MQNSTLIQVKSYYGDVLSSTKDLQTSACCSTETVPEHHKAILSQIHPEVLDRFYGCGCPIPPTVDGLTVLDLGSGTGRDAFLLSKLVGNTGQVIGIDMTDNQLEIARRHEAYHAETYGYAQPNTRFVHGYIEDLASAGIPSDSVDLIVSNCVINLSPDKQRVFAEMIRVLKPGGEFYFSDVFADRRISDDLRNDPVLYGECLSGALYLEDFRRLLLDLGIRDVREVSRREMTVDQPKLAAKLGPIRFYSITVRGFKLDLEDQCEDYGQTATYLGTMSECPHQFMLDDHHVLEAHRPMLVCGNTADMLGQTRFAPHFRIEGDKARHFGLFDCAPGVSSAGGDSASGSCC